MTTCAEIMTTEPQCCEPSMTVDKIAQTMRNEGIGPVPIVDTMDNMRLVGVVTDRDLLKVIAEQMNPSATQADAIMTRDPVACRPSDSIAQAMALIAENKLDGIPIIDDAHRLVGIISQGDLARKASRKMLFQ